jgi:disulfide bond formation protein DsbB
MIVAVITSLLAMTGAGVAAWHLWIKANPPESFSCGRPFAWMMENMPLTDVLPKLFKGEADCLQENWTLLGLGIPHWSLILFLLLMALADFVVVQTVRTKKSAP